MTRLFIVVLALFLAGCLTLPGSDGTAPTRYTLKGLGQACIAGERPIAVSIVQCELRALELQETAESDRAVVALSCIYRGGDGAEQALVASSSTPLARWNATTAVQALGLAYAEVFDSLVARIP